MKKNILLAAAFLFAGIYSASAQSGLKPPPPGGPSAKCDSLSVDSVSVIAPGSVHLFLHNRSAVTAANPRVKAGLDPNAYMALDTTSVTVAALNDSITNNGITQFTVGIESIVSEDSIPLNTVFTGTLHISEPTDTLIFCDVPFTFTYGKRVGAGISEIASSPIILTVSADQLTIKGNIQNATLQLISVSGQTLFADTRNSNTTVRTLSLANLPAGMYFLAIQKDNERIVRRFLKN